MAFFGKAIPFSIRRMGIFMFFRHYCTVLSQEDIKHPATVSLVQTPSVPQPRCAILLSRQGAVKQEGNFPLGSIGEKTLFTNFVYLNKTSSFSPYFFIIVFQEICCRILFQTQLSDLIGQVEFTDLYDGASHIYY
ncbi:MAG: hypothetical protein D3910_15225 [Candidatus Electrothrix sp. ATG2]|nr:hypothetical protein [Candidatus Electrothrix sp. ATG2]